MIINIQAIRDCMKYIEKDYRPHLRGIHIKAVDDIIIYEATNAQILLRVVEPRVKDGVERMPAGTELLLNPIKDKFSWPKGFFANNHAELKMLDDGRYMFEFIGGKDAYLFTDLLKDGVVYPNVNTLVPHPEDLVPVYKYAPVNPKLLAIIQETVNGRSPLVVKSEEDNDKPHHDKLVWEGEYGTESIYIAMLMCMRCDCDSMQFERNLLGVL